MYRLESGRGAAAASSDYFSSSFHSDTDTSGINSSELSDAALSELMVSGQLIIFSVNFIINSLSASSHPYSTLMLLSRQQ